MTYKKLSDVLAAFPTLKMFPWTARYILLFGTSELMTIPYHTRDMHTAEKVYEECVKKGKTWRELYGAGNSDMEEGIQL